MLLEFVHRFCENNFGNWSSFASWTIEHKIDDVTSVDWSTIGCWGELFVLFFAVMVIFLLCNKAVEWLSKHLSLIALLVWVAGVGVYMVGFYQESLNGISVVLRSVIASFKMFAAANELARVPKFLQVDATYMTIFSTVHFLAAFITTLFIFKMVGYKIKCSINILKRRMSLLKMRREVHLFWGVNEASCLLAEDIRRHHKDDTIIFVDVDEENDDGTKKKATLASLTNSITIKNSEMIRLNQIGALVDHCYGGPAELNGEGDIDIFKALHLRSIRRIVCKSRKSLFYFLSDNEAQNIAGALNFQRDKGLCSLKRNRPTIYVHARRDANNEVFDHYSQYDSTSQRMPIKLVDSAYLSTEVLKRRPSALPVNCVKVDTKTGLVDSPFNALIVGFGSVGQEAFKFLYEFSAFVSPDGKTKSPFKCYAVDEKMDKIEGVVRKKMPAISSDELELIKSSVDTTAFWDLVEKSIDELNYVVVSLNNDKLGLALAVNIFKYALKSRSERSPKLKIAIRCYDRDNEKRMVEVVDNLNRSIDGERVDILIYGKEKEIYSCETIISEYTMAEAKEFHRVYSKSKLSAEEQWRKDFVYDDKEEMSIVDSKLAKQAKNREELEKNHEEILSRYHMIHDINRKVAQNISNTLHISTKMRLMGFDEESRADAIRPLLEDVEKREDKEAKYDVETSPFKTLFTNLAVIEHERWIASHKLMGYVVGPEKLLAKKQFKYMCPFEDLDPGIQKYDYLVIYTTIKIAHAKAKAREIAKPENRFVEWLKATAQKLKTQFAKRGE